jgi:hypothetical protein
VNIDDSLEDGYRPGEILHVKEEWFERFYKNSIPVTEISMKDGNEMKFPAQVPFVVKNSTEWDPFDEDSECYDMFGHMLYKSNKRSYVQNTLPNSYHSYYVNETGVSSCVPFIGKKNNVHLGYWNNNIENNMSYVTPMHADGSANYMWCKEGLKYVFLWNPDDHDNLYINNWDKSGSGSTRRSPYRVENVNMSKYPNYWRAKRYVVKMEANDILHMPYKWIHHVYTMPGSSCINYWHDNKIYNEPFHEKKTDTTIILQTRPPNFMSSKNTTDEEEELWWMEDVIALRLALGNGQLIKIPNAFPNHEELQLRIDDDWENQRRERNGYEWFDRDVCHNCSKRFVKEIKKYRKFWERLLSLKLKPPSVFKGTRYTQGQYLETHNDNVEDRILSLVYHMTGDWNPDCGGEFEWNGNIGSSAIVPSYNTLYMFIPRENSNHRIKEVYCGHRVGYSGWLYAEDFSIDFLTMLHTHRWNQENRPGDVWDVTSGVDGPKSKPSTLEEVKEWY